MHDFGERCKEFSVSYCSFKEQIIKDRSALYNLGIEDLDFLIEIMDYNVKGGKCIRGSLISLFTDICLSLFSPDDANFREIKRLAMILGWCIEMLQAVFLILDDIMDNSITRRSKLCWYKQENVGLRAINDAYFLEQSIYIIINHFMNKHEKCSEMIMLFHTTSSRTTQGQHLDLTFSKSGQNKEFENFTTQNYEKIVLFKTTFYSFLLPLEISKYLCHKFLPKMFESQILSNCLIKVGRLFQIHDDFLDFGVDSSITGKIGTDIADGKCTWFSVKALELLDEDKRTVFLKNYGKNEGENVIKKLYSDLKLSEMFTAFGNSEYEDICNTIKSISDEASATCLQNFVNYILKRQY